MSVESLSHSSSKSFCHQCLDKNSQGVFKCEGCEKKFCLKHTNEHREMLRGQLLELVDEQTTFFNEVNGENLITTKLFDQIDQWEKQSIDRIHQTAENLRTQAYELARQQIETTRSKFNQLNAQLLKAYDENQYLESDINRWKILLEQLKCDHTILSPMINVEEDQHRTLIRPLCLTKTSSQLLIDETLFSYSSQIHFDDQKYLAMHCGPERGPAYISGTREYQTGQHFIRFLLTKSTDDFIISFNIMSNSMTLTPNASSDSSYLVFGWQSNDCINPSYLANNNEKVRTDLRLHRRLLIELMLDCEQQKIIYYNERTKQRKELCVDLIKCPLPWKLYFYLYNIGDSVRLLSTKSVH